MYGSLFLRGRLAGLLSVAIFLTGCGGGGSGGGSGGGDSSFSSARGVAVDGGGNVFIAGDTNATLGPGSMGDYDMFVIKNDPGSGTQWIQQFGTALFDMASAVAVDNAGNVYMAGYTQYDPWSPTGMGGCLLLVKYDGNGSGLWYLIVGEYGSAEAHAVATDNAGNVFVAGSTYGSIDGTTPNAGGQDLFVIKLDGDGNVLWSRQMGSADVEYAMGVSVDRAGNSYVTGTTYGSLDGNASAGGSDPFVIKYDSDGNKLWTRQRGTSGADYGNAVATDNNGNVTIVGETYGSMDGNPSAGSSDLFAIKYDSDGNWLWTRQRGTSTWDRANGVATDGEGNIYVAGTTNGSLDGNINVDPGGGDLVLIKFDGMGNRQWTRQTGGTGSQWANGVAVDGVGNIYAVGASSSGMYSQDYLVVKYDSAGNRM